MIDMTVGLDDLFMFRIYNTFRDQPRQMVIRILRRQFLHPIDMATLVAEAEERDIKVSELISAIIQTYARK